MKDYHHLDLYWVRTERDLCRKEAFIPVKEKRKVDLENFLITTE